ncbi:MAG: aldehyde dehydrogenase [Planctomycetota bacterium]|jgi:aldehyde dehydrogenase
MTQVNEQAIQQMVEEVLRHVQSGWGGRQAPTAGKDAPPPISTVSAPSGGYAPAPARPAAMVAPTATAGRLGQFADVNQAVEAAKVAQRALVVRSLAQRKQIVDTIRRICVEQADELGRMEYEETKIGHLPHKPDKLVAVGTNPMGLEFLAPKGFSGDHGITMEERGAWGVIGVITPVTHSLPTVADNACNMIAAGNSLVINPHPGGKRVAAYGAKLFNQAIYDAVGIDNLICVILEPTLDTANAIFSHPDVGLLGITGGPGVVAAALKSGKRAICAGPGNPPVVVDASADMDNAARCVIEGGAYDNNLLCLAEKEVFVEACVFESFMDAMNRAGACRLTTEQMDALAKICIEPGSNGGHPHANRKFVGAEPEVFARELGMSIPAGCRMFYGETHATHDWVMAEQMMPVMPIVRCETFEQCVEAAFVAEHGFRHTSIIHSRLVDHMTYMGKAMDTTLFVKNGPSLAGNGAGGEGYGGYSIACGTGEGVCTPRTYTRLRRCAMIDNLRIV